MVVTDMSLYYLKDILHYNKDTGIFVWKKSPRNGRIGDVAGSLHKSGYIHIQIDKKMYKAHRLAWLYIYGEESIGVIDHVNGIKKDNRIQNLRSITQRENCQNRASHREGKKVGITFIKRLNKWQAQAMVNGKNRYIGVYHNEEDAVNAYNLFIKDNKIYRGGINENNV